MRLPRKHCIFLGLLFLSTCHGQGNSDGNQGNGNQGNGNQGNGNQGNGNGNNGDEMTTEATTQGEERGTSESKDDMSTTLLSDDTTDNTQYVTTETVTDDTTVTVTMPTSNYENITLEDGVTTDADMTSSGPEATSHVSDTMSNDSDTTSQVSDVTSTDPEVMSQVSDVTSSAPDITSLSSDFTSTAVDMTTEMTSSVCDVDPCQNDGVCVDLGMTYSCNCTSNWTGKNCTEEVNPCNSDPCENGGNCTMVDFTTYSCACAQGYTSQQCETDIDDCAEDSCMNGGTCQDIGVDHVRCDCPDTWEGDQCQNDIDECDPSRDPCDSVANCTNTPGSFTCTCPIGYQGDGFTCEFTDPCASSDCGQGGFCFSNSEDYDCICYIGWSGDNCSTEVDLCLTQTVCHATWGECVPVSTGRVLCQCMEGSHGDGKVCYEEVIMSHNVNRTIKHNDATSLTVNVDGGIPIFGQLFKTLHVSPHGYVSFGSDFNKPNAPRSAYEWPANTTIIAPYWGWGGGETYTNERAGVYVEQYDMETLPMHPEILRGIHNITMKKNETMADEDMPPVSSVIRITWREIPKWPVATYTEAKLVLITNGYATLAIFNYGHGFMSQSSGRMYAIGFSNGVDIVGNPIPEVVDFERPDISSNIGTRGRFVLRLGEPVRNPKMPCLQWYYRHKSHDMSGTINGCPCTLAQAQVDPFYNVYMMRPGENCYKSMMGSKMQICCYDGSSGALLTGPPSGGYMTSTEVDVTMGYDMCCKQNDLCHLVYKVSPSDNCTSYSPPSIGAVFGDPHIWTVDASATDTEFTFNGAEEYILLQADNRLMLQGRFSPLQGVNATRLTALAVKGNTTSVVEVRETSGLSLAVDSSDVSGDTEIEGILITISANEESTIKLTDDDVILKVQAMYGYLMMRVYVNSMNKVLPSSGLLGTVNDDFGDDFTTREGQALSNNQALTEGEIFGYGRNWKLAEAESIFGYSLDGADASFGDFQHPDFQPVYWRDIIADNLNNLTAIGDWNTTLALDTCADNIACLVDLVITNEVDIATATRNFQEALRQDKKVLTNRPPVFVSAMSVALVTLDDIMTTIEFSVQDDSDTDINVTIVTNISPDSFTFGAVDGSTNMYKFEWRKPDDIKERLMDTRYTVKFLAADSTGATAMFWPALHIFTCPTMSQSIWDTDMDDYAFQSDRFMIPRCSCSRDENDIFCDEAVDPCSPNPCFYNVTCTAQDDSFTCGSCPLHLVGDGRVCHDLDECDTGDAGCGQICKNTPGSFECSCSQGYQLRTDNKTCYDVDECREGTHDCSGNGNLCYNTEGSFECRCGARFFDSGDKKCIFAPTKYNGKMKIEAYESSQGVIDWDDALLDKTSALFAEVANDVQALVTLAMSSRFNDAFVGARVVSFSKGSIVAKYDLYFVESANVNITEVDKAMSNQLRSEGCVEHGKDCRARALLAISLLNSSIAEKDLCESSYDNDCEPSSTNCMSQGGSFSCACKDGYGRFHDMSDMCVDIDECDDDMMCDNMTSSCLNLPGSYECQCRYGYMMQDGACVDVCNPSPCDHNASCVQQESSYVCLCEGMWTGQNCSEEHEEAVKFRTIAIAVGAAIGVVCIILLIILIIVFCRTYEEGYQNGSDITLDKWDRPQRSNPEFQDPSRATTAFTDGKQGVENPAYSQSSQP